MGGDGIQQTRRHYRSQHLPPPSLFFSSLLFSSLLFSSILFSSLLFSSLLFSSLLFSFFSSLLFSSLLFSFLLFSSLLFSSLVVGVRDACCVLHVARTLQMVATSTFVQSAFSLQLLFWHWRDFGKEIQIERNVDLCSQPWLLQTCATGIFITLMLNNIPGTSVYLSVCLGGSKREREVLERARNIDRQIDRQTL